MTSRSPSPAKKAKWPNGTVHLAKAVEDAYLSFDQEDYCNDEQRCGKCWGCMQYGLLKKAYRIACSVLNRP